MKSFCSDLSDLGGQVLEDVLLHAPQKEGQRLTVERLHGQGAGLLLLGRRLGVAAGQNGLAVARLELLLAAQEARNQEVEQRPQFQHVVLNGRARQDQPVIGHQSLDGPRRLGLAVFDHVTLKKRETFQGKFATKKLLNGRKNKCD